MITDYRVDQNIKSDVELIKDRLPIIKENTGCKDLYVDGGFYSDEVVELGKDNGVNLHFTNLSGREPSKKLSVTEYQINESTNKVSQRNNSYSYRYYKRPDSSPFSAKSM